MQDKHYIGHRKRLKERILNNPPESLADYEIIELLLFFAVLRKDVKPLAKKLLEKFNDINNLLQAEMNKFLDVEGTNSNMYALFLAVRELSRRTLSSKVMHQNIINSWAALIDYLKFTSGNSKIEKFRILFLNAKNILIADEIMGTGTIDQAPVYPREIVKKALFYEASSIILVHNHPSGSTKPSRSDIELTNRIVEVCKSVNINVHDHVIVSSNEYYSFKSNMLM